jgi:hypothetical protein
LGVVFFLLDHEHPGFLSVSAPPPAPVEFSGFSKIGAGIDATLLKRVAILCRARAYIFPPGADAPLASPTILRTAILYVFSTALPYLESHLRELKPLGLQRRFATLFALQGGAAPRAAALVSSSRPFFLQIIEIPPQTAVQPDTKL